MLGRINELLKGDESFAFETTLATRSYKSKVVKAQQNGYTVILLFFWLNNVELAKERVKTRVKEGGHNIPSKVIERRYIKGIINLFDIYIDIVDGTMVFDNSYGKHELIAQKIEDEKIMVLDKKKFNQIKEYYDYKGKAN